ncbi:hypothetical protein F4680DRAFT_448746 [Xylaria scruposa]|nr:hypothetical protein F4680DRAFT_448746 [Xylaria scruposa]
MLRQCSTDGRRPSTALVDTLADSLLDPFQTDAPDDPNCTWLDERDQNDEEIDDPWWSIREFFRTSRQHYNTKSDKLCYDQSNSDEKQEEIWGEQIPLAPSISPSMLFDISSSQEDVSFQQPLPDNEVDDTLKSFFPLSWNEKPDNYIYGGQEDESESDGTITPPYVPPPPGPDQLPIPLHIKSKRNSERRRNTPKKRKVEKAISTSICYVACVGIVT